jgi:RecG-like helicase
LERVVATIVPFDVDRITSISNIEIHQSHEEKPESTTVLKAPIKKTEPVNIEPISHHTKNVTSIGDIQWRKRAKVQGEVKSIKSAPRGAAPTLQVEIWDETGGVSLHFLGRRDIAGLEVGSLLRAEGMVGEENGSMVILNPSYELLV